MAAPLITIIDDNAATSRLLDEVLREAGFRTTITGWDEQTVATIHADQPSLIILALHLDQHLPWTEVGRLNDTSATQHTPVLACGDDVQLVQAAATNLNKHLTSYHGCTYDPEECLAKVRTIIALSQPKNDVDAGLLRQIGDE